MDFIIDIMAKAGPFGNVVVAVLLVFVFRAISANTTAITKQSDAMVAMSTAMDKLATALSQVAKNQETAGSSQSEMIRMLERSMSAEDVRYTTSASAFDRVLNSLTNLGNLINAALNHRGART